MGSTPEPTRAEVTNAMERFARGEAGAAERLAPLVYDELRRIAAAYLARERSDHTLQPTALVNEAFVRLAGQAGAPVEGRAHFRALASQAMRRILVDHARARFAARRDERVVTLSGVPEDGDDGAVDLLGLDSALTRLASLNPRQARVVELRFFGGLEIEEVANELGVSPRTVNGDWRVARAWLGRELTAGG